MAYAAYGGPDCGQATSKVNQSECHKTLAFFITQNKKDAYESVFLIYFFRIDLPCPLRIL